MQKFVVGPCVNGLQITKKAIKYLASQYGDEENPKYIQLIDEYAKCFSSANSDKSYTRFENIPEEYKLVYAITLSFRKLLVDAVEKLNGDYSKLDKLNNDLPIRLVEIDSDKQFHITEDDSGYEYVEELKTIYIAPSDEENFAYKTAKQFLLNLKHEPIISSTKVENGKEILKCVADGEFALVKVMKRSWKDGEIQYHEDEWFYYKAKYNEYYDKSFYEILGQQENAFFGTIKNGIDMKEYNSMFNLMKNMENA